MAPLKNPYMHLYMSYKCRIGSASLNEVEDTVRAITLYGYKRALLFYLSHLVVGVHFS